MTFGSFLLIMILIYYVAICNILAIGNVSGKTTNNLISAKHVLKYVIYCSEIGRYYFLL